MSVSSHISLILYGMGYRKLVDYLNSTKLSSGFQILITHTIRVINHQVQVTHHTKTCITTPLWLTFPLCTLDYFCHWSFKQPFFIFLNCFPVINIYRVVRCDVLTVVDKMWLNVVWYVTINVVEESAASISQIAEFAIQEKDIQGIEAKDLGSCTLVKRKRKLGSKGLQCNCEGVQGKT